MDGQSRLAKHAVNDVLDLLFCCAFFLHYETMFRP